MSNLRLGSDYVNSGEFLKFQGGRALFATSEIQNPAYFVYLLGIARHLQKINCGVDFIFFVDPSQRKFKKAIRYFEEGLNRYELYNSKISLILKKPDLNQHESIILQLDSMKTIGDFKNLASRFKHLSDSIYSTYCSSYSLTSDPKYALKRMKNKHLDLGRDFLINYEHTTSLLNTQDYNSVFFFNGRYPSQAGIKEAAEEAGIEWFAVEHGSVPGSSIHVEKFQTQDRVLIQSFIRDWSARLRVTDVEVFSRQSQLWLKRQESDISQNPFIRTSATGYQPLAEGGKLATIFTSSLDEEIACPGWGDDDIRTLMERTVRLGKKLMSEGFVPVVVIHPNTGNKTWHDLSLMYKTFTEEGISFIAPWAQVSSYQLARQSEVIATWRSTIGLEMIAKSFSINLLSESQYDLLLNPCRIGDNRISYCAVGDRTPDSNLANLIIYYYSHHGYRLESFLDGIPLSLEILSFRKILLEKNWVLGVRRRLKLILVLFRGFSATPNEYFKFLKPIFGVRFSRLILKILQWIYARKYF
jgi:hypothetical protein